MINPPGVDRELLIRVLIGRDVQPWLGRADWGTALQAYNNVASEPVSRTKTLKDRYYRLVNWLDSNGHSIGEYATQVMSGVAEADVTPTSGRSDRELLVEAGFDPDKYVIAQASAWGRGDDLSLSVKVKPRTSATDPSGYAQALTEAVNKVKPFTSGKAITKVPDEDRLALISILDLHLEKNEGGRGHREKSNLFCRTVSSLIDRCGPVTRYVFPFGNDFGNFDNVYGTTTAGTPQDNTLTWQGAIDLRVQLLTWAIEGLLRTGAKVTVIAVPGNHDTLTTYMLGKVLEARYGDKVEILNDHNPRKYYLWRNCGFMLTHGSEEKKADLPLIFATEAPEVFVGSEWREILTGHFHTASGMYQERFGIFQRVLPSLSKADNWHRYKGYVGNKCGGVGLVYGPKGLLAEHFTYDL